MIHQIDRNKRFFLSAFQQGLLQNLIKKTVVGIFKIALHLRYRHVFMRQSLEILNVFNTANLIQIFKESKIYFKKLECCFLVENTKTENGSFPYYKLLYQKPVL